MGTRARDGSRPLSWDQRRFLTLLAFPSLALALSITLVTTYLPVFLAELSGPAITGLLIGSEGILALVVPMLAGAGSDEVSTRLGRRMPFLVVATPPTVIALVLMPFAGSIAGIVGLLLVFYSAYFTYYSPYYALFPDLVPREVRGRSQGFQNVLREAGLGAALVGGGVLLGLWRPLPFIVAGGVLAAVTAVFAWRVREPEMTGGGRSREGVGRRAVAVLRENPALRWTALATGLWEFALGALKTFVVLFFTVGLGRSIESASLVLALVAGAVLAAAVVAGKLADRFGHEKLLRAALCVYGLGLLVPAITQAPPVLAIVPFVAFAAGVVMTLPFSLMMSLMPSESHGAASGLYGFTRGAGVLLGPVAAGLAIEFLEPVFAGTDGYAAMFPVASAAIFASIPVLGVIRRRAGRPV